MGRAFPKVELIWPGSTSARTSFLCILTCFEGGLLDQFVFLCPGLIMPCEPFSVLCPYVEL